MLVVHIGKMVSAVCVGMSKDDIIRHVQSAAEQGTVPARGALVENFDFSNIIGRCGLKKFQKHGEDSTSVALWVAELKEEGNSPVVFFQPPGPSADGWPNGCLVVMSDLQADVLLKRLHQGDCALCVDSTHDTSQYSYKLATLVVVSRFGKGFPVAWAVIPEEDQPSLEMFFSAVKQKLDDKQQS